MNLRVYIVAFSLLLVTQPAVADEADTMVWNFDVAGALRAMQDSEDLCRPNPYGLYRRGCSPRDLHFYDDRDDGPRLTILDRLALFVYRYKDLNLDADIRPNAKLKFSMSLMNLYEQEAKARVELRIRF
jgi:hypothetical protein